MKTGRRRQNMSKLKVETKLTAAPDIKRIGQTEWNKQLFKNVALNVEVGLLMEESLQE